MQIDPLKSVLAVSALTVPGTAQAQHIPPTIVALALSPVLVLLLAVVLGIVKRSWKAGLAHAGLIVVWIVLFGVAAYWVENDYVIWTPLLLYVVHALIVIVLIVKGVLLRRRR
jgi:hypothetical protein